MRKLVNNKIAAVAAGAIVVASAGAAYAYWSTTGGGSGTASSAAGTADIDVTQQSSPSDLAPGIAPDAVTATITNNSAEAAGYVNTVTVTVGQPYRMVGTPAVKTDAANCSATDFGLVAGSTAAAALTSGVQSITMDVKRDLAASGGSTGVPAFELGFINKDNADQSGCKSVIVPLAYGTN